MTTAPPTVLRYAAFSTTAAGGNPAGVVLDATGLDEAAMQQVAADVGYSETAFLTRPDPADDDPRPDPRADATFRVRYFAPLQEVAFCGHATIAAGVALGRTRGPGLFTLLTGVGTVPLTVARGEDGPDAFTSSFESPPADALPLPAAQLDDLLTALDWSGDDLDPGFPPLVATAGNRHPVLVASDLHRLGRLDYDVGALATLCRRHDWTTVQLVVRVTDRFWRSRNPFPVGGVVEDPATGSAAAAFGGYLRALGRVRPGDRLVVEQGVELGRPGTIHVLVGPRTVTVTGTAAPIVGP